MRCAWPALATGLVGLGGAKQHLHSLAACPARIGGSSDFESVTGRVVHYLLAVLAHSVLLEAQPLPDHFADSGYLSAIQVCVLPDILPYVLPLSCIEHRVYKLQEGALIDVILF